MLCSVIRDLIPLYEEKLCSKETAMLVEGHLMECSHCRSLYNEIHEDIGLKEAVKQGNLLDAEFEQKGNERKEREFWRRYYGSLILKGTGIFVLAYVLIIAIGLLVI